MNEVQKLLLSVSLELVVLLIFGSLGLILVLNGRPEGVLLVIPMVILGPLAADLVKR